MLGCEFIVVVGVGPSNEVEGWAVKRGIILDGFGEVSAEAVEAERGRFLKGKKSSSN